MTANKNRTATTSVKIVIAFTFPESFDTKVGEVLSKTSRFPLIAYPDMINSHNLILLNKI